MATSYFGYPALPPTTGWQRVTFTPSVNHPGTVLTTFVDGPNAGRLLRVEPDGNDTNTSDPGSDGPYEQGQPLNGETRLVVDYSGLVAPKVYDKMVSE